MTIFRFVIIRSLRRRSMLISMCALPIAMAFMSPMWDLETGSGIGFYGMIIMFCAFSLSQFIMNDRVNGTAVRIFSAPITTFQYLSQNLLAFWIILSVQITLVIGLVSFLHNWDTLMSAYIAFAYIVFATSCIAFSLAWNSMFRSKLMSTGVFSIIISFMAILGGIFVPIETLPNTFRIIGMIFPTYWLSSSMNIILNQEITVQFWMYIGIMLLFSIAFLLYGSKRRLQ